MFFYENMVNKKGSCTNGCLYQMYGLIVFSMQQFNCSGL